MERVQRQRLLAGFLTGILTFSLIAPSFAGALEAELVNDTTGADSDNTNTVDGTKTITFTVTNTGDATNDFDLDLNSGGNTVESNTVVGDVATGDIEFEIEAENEINTQNVDFSALEALGHAGDTIIMENRNTGAGSTNDNAATIDETLDTTITNTGTATNTVVLDLNTGDNTIADNTVVGDITTGDIIGKIGPLITRINTPPTRPPGPPTPGPTPAQPTGGGDRTPPVAPIASVMPLLPMQPQAQVAAATPAQAAQVAVAPKGEFFPAGSPVPALAVLTGLMAVALVTVFAGDVSAALKRAVRTVKLSLLLLTPQVPAFA